MTKQAPPKLPTEVQNLVDREQLVALLDRYLATLDDGGFDDAWSRSLFTDDVRIEFPLGALEGVEGVADQHRAVMTSWDRTLHLSTNHLIELDGDRARLRAPLVAIHVHPATESKAPLLAAHILEADAVRTTDGWRFERFALRPVWTVGDAPAGLEAKRGPMT